MSQALREEIHNDVGELIEDAVSYAEASPLPSPEELRRDVYAPGPESASALVLP